MDGPMDSQTTSMPIEDFSSDQRLSTCPETAIFCPGVAHSTKDFLHCAGKSAFFPGLPAATRSRLMGCGLRSLITNLARRNCSMRQAQKKSIMTAALFALLTTSVGCTV